MPNRQINNHDLIKYLQENQALLKTILRRLELSSNNPNQQQVENVELYREFLKGIEDTFDANTIINP